MDGCKGTPTFLQKLLRDSKGHQVVAVQGSVVGGGDQILGIPARRNVEQFLCVQCEGWPQGRGAKLGRVCLPPIRKGVEVLQSFRRGMGPNPRLRAAIDRVLPFPQVDLTATSRRQARAVTRVRQVMSSSSQQVPAAPLEVPGYEVRLQALLQRIQAKEARQGADPLP